jgi:hypothetical protein
MSSLTVNQALNLLWIHYREEEHEIGLTEPEVIDLTLLVVSKYEDLTSPYKDALIPKSKGELVDVLRSPEGPAGLFAVTH